MKRNATTAIVTALATLACVPGSAAAAAPADQIPVANAATSWLALPADARDYSDLSRIFAAAPMMRADGGLAWVYSRQRAADDPRALGFAATAPGGGADVRLATVKRSVHSRFDPASRSSNVVTAVGGLNWVLDGQRRPGRSVLLGIDDRERVVRRLSLPSGIRYSALISTARGLRALGVVRTKNRTYGWRTRVVIVNPATGRVVRVPLIGIVQLAGLPDGSLLVAGPAGGGSAAPLLRVTPGGKVTQLRDRRSPAAASVVGERGMVATRAGILLDERSERSDDDFKSAVVLRDRVGKVAARRLLREIPLPAAAGCELSDPERKRFLVSLAVGPDGLPVLRMYCGTSPYGTYSHSGTAGSSVMVGLTETLELRWWRTAPEAMYRAEGWTRTEYCHQDLVDADRRLATVGCAGRLTTVAVPDALPAALGKARSTRRVERRLASVRISCKGVPGSICAGQAQVVSGGRVFGSARYALPARARAGGAVQTRHIATSSSLPRRFTVRLVANAGD